MGADGGICWIYPVEPAEENRKILLQLIPEPVLFWDDGRDYVAEEWKMGHDFYLKEIPKGVISATYGSFQPMCLERLRDALYDAKQYIDDGFGTASLRDMYEIAKDEKKNYNNEGWYQCHQSRLYRFLIECFEYDQNNPLLDMTLEAWYDGINSRCRKDYYGGMYIGRIETWT